MKDAKQMMWLLSFLMVLLLLQFLECSNALQIRHQDQSLNMKPNPFKYDEAIDELYQKLNNNEIQWIALQYKAEKLRVIDYGNQLQDFFDQQLQVNRSIIGLVAIQYKQILNKKEVDIREKIVLGWLPKEVHFKDRSITELFYKHLQEKYSNLVAISCNEYFNPTCYNKALQFLQSKTSNNY